MEENDERSRDEERQESSEESNRDIIPLLQPPGHLLPHRVTNFFIDNILRPDFGRRKEGIFPGDDRSVGGRETRSLSLGGTGQVGGTAAGEGSSNPPSVTGGKKPDIGQEQRLKARGEGPRSRKPKKKSSLKEDKRPRTAFTAEQLHRLKAEFQTNRYLTEQRRQSLARELGLNESQIKIWFQNKRAKIKKASGGKNALALHLMAQGLYNHSTAEREDKEDKEDSD